MDYQVKGYERQYTRLVVSCIYLVLKENITLPITDQEMIKIAIFVITPAGNSLELYIGAIIENFNL